MIFKKFNPKTKVIHDLLSQSSRYENLHPSFPAAFAWLKNFDPSTPDGKYEITGPDCVAGVQRYTTKPCTEKKWEAHQIFGDIQVVYFGDETCGHTDVTGLKSSEAYSASKDVEKFVTPTFPTTQLHLRSGYFTVFYPQDAHQPGVTRDQPTEVLKVVIKFKL